MNSEIQLVALNGFYLCLSVSLFLVLFRLVRGPSLADRVVALDLFSTILLSAIAVTAIYVDEVLYLDVAIILALFGFVGTAIFARFIQGQERQK